MPFRSKTQQRLMYAKHPDIAERWTNEMRGGKNASKEQKEHPIKHAGLPNKVGKRMSGGSFDSGPSTIVQGIPKAKVRRNKTLARYAGNPGHGKRYGPEPGLELYKPSRVAKGVPFTPTSVLSRAGKLPQMADTGLKTMQAGMQAGKAGTAPGVSPVGRGGKALVATGQKLGQVGGVATATPMRTATTGGAVGAAGTAATMSAVDGQKDPNNVGKVLGSDQPWHEQPGAVARHQARQAASTTAENPRERGVMVVRTHGSSPRNYDPESHRQRRLGAVQASANIGGAAGVVAGGAHLRELNRKAKVTARDGTSTGVRRAVAVNRRGAGLIGVGLAGLAAGEKIRRHANDPSNRAWR